MSNDSGSSIRRISGFAGAAVAVALLASACASSGNGNSGGSTAANPPGGAPASQSKSASAVEIETHSGPLGTFLTDSAGKSIYMFASDTASKSTCNGSCVAYWPPVPGSAAAKGGASGTLSVITRDDGSKQAAYDGHPLYYYKEDTASGDTKGQGSNNFGAKWWLLTPGGKPITASGPAAASSSSAGGGGGGWS
jgi:predicted lipoprotein with Yx(FWY)xxD motif